MFVLTLVTFKNNILLLLNFKVSGLTIKCLTKEILQEDTFRLMVIMLYFCLVKAPLIVGRFNPLKQI